MTNLQEAKLAREAEICYATVAMVTDYDCWREGHDSVTIDEIVRVPAPERSQRRPRRQSRRRRHASRTHLAPAPPPHSTPYLTTKEAIPAATKEKLSLLFGKYLS